MLGQKNLKTKYIHSDELLSFDPDPALRISSVTTVQFNGCALNKKFTSDSSFLEPLCDVVKNCKNICVEKLKNV
jgi:hypothetical protein